MAVQRSGRSRVTSGLCRDAAHAGGAEGSDQQDRPQRCARHRANDAGGALPPGACEDAPQPETANAVDPSPAIAVEGDRHRERSTRYFTQLRPQGRNGRKADSSPCVGVEVVTFIGHKSIMSASPPEAAEKRTSKDRRLGPEATLLGGGPMSAAVATRVLEHEPQSGGE